MTLGMAIQLLCSDGKQRTMTVALWPTMWHLTVRCAECTAVVLDSDSMLAEDAPRRTVRQAATVVSLERPIDIGSSIWLDTCLSSLLFSAVQ